MVAIEQVARNLGPNRFEHHHSNRQVKGSIAEEERKEKIEKPLQEQSRSRALALRRTRSRATKNDPLAQVQRAFSLPQDFRSFGICHAFYSYTLLKPHIHRSNTSTLTSSAMPRKSQKKQTRLAFAPAAASASGEGSEDHNDRFARVSYGYPSLAAMRPGTSRKSTSEEPKKKLSKPSKSSKPSKRTQSPDRPAEPPTQEAQSMLASPRVAVEISSISPLAKAHLSKKAYEEESSDDDIVVPSSHRKRRAPTETDVSATSPAEASKRSTRKSKRNVPSKHDADADDSVEEISRPRRRLKRKAESSPIVLSNSDESEEPVPSSPVKRRRRAADPETPQTSQDGARRDQMDIEEDLRDLQDSGTTRKAIESLGQCTDYIHSGEEVKDARSAR